MCHRMSQGWQFHLSHSRHSLSSWQGRPECWASRLLDFIHQPARHVGWVRGGGMLCGGSEDQRIPFAQDCLVCRWLAPRRQRGNVGAHVPPWTAVLRAPLHFDPADVLRVVGRCRDDCETYVCKYIYWVGKTNIAELYNLLVLWYLSDTLLYLLFLTILLTHSLPYSYLIACEKLPMFRIVAMPASVVRAGEVPEATLRRLCAAAHTVELVAQPGQIRVRACMANAQWCWSPRGSSGRSSVFCSHEPRRCRTPA